MNSTHIISQDVFDKIRSRFQNLEMGDEQGNVTIDPKEARFFDFDFVVEGKNLGRVSISINETGSLKVFYSQGILEETEDWIHQLWYDFLREMRMFAKRRLLRFDTRDITKSNLDKDDFQYLANKNVPEEDPAMNMSESVKFEGGKKTSYRVLEKTKLIAKHKRSIENEDHGARSRGSNIKALYIENSDGERFKYPFIHIAGAKAMQRHVANGGRPYDDRGEAIIKMSEEIIQLSSFKRHVGRPDALNQRVNEITSKTDSKLESLRRTMEGLANQGYYEKWAESFVPNKAESIVMDQATLEDYKSAFTVSSFREDLAQYFPLIHSIMQEAGTVDLEDIVHEASKEEVCDDCERPVSKCVCDHANEGVFKSFEDWAEALAEGRLEPDTLMSLKDLLDKGLTLDVDGTSAIDALEGIGIHDEELFSKLKDLSDPEKGGNPSNDPKATILSWLNSFDPEAAQEFGHSDEPEQEPEQDVDQEPESEGIYNEENPSVRDVAEMVYSMYNRHHKEEGLGPFPKGAQGVIDHVTKQLGDRAGVLAEKLVAHLSGDSQPEVNEETTSNEAAEIMNQELESIMKLAGVAKVDEAVEDRTSYQVAKFLFDKGLRYNAENEKQIINKMDDAMIAMNIPAKTIQYLLRHDEDFISDTLGELRHMEAVVDELAMTPPMPADVPPMEEGADMDKIPAFIRKQKQQSQDTAQKATDKRNKDSGAKVWSSPRTNEELSIIAKLAGLAK